MEKVFKRNPNQTSVDWLVDKILYDKNFSLKELLEMARERHKNEIIEAYDDGTQLYYDLNLPTSGDEYYQKMFNGK